MSKNRKAVVYVRGGNPDLQVAEAEGYARSQSMDVTGVYSDVGLPGYGKETSALREMLEAASGGSFDVVVVPEVSRLSRSVEKVLDIFRELDKNGVKVISAKEGILDYRDLLHTTDGMDLV